MLETEKEIAARRQELIRGCRNTGMDALKGPLAHATADDLAWFLERIESQIEETPHWVTERDILERIQTDLRNKRIVVSGMLGTRRSAERSALEHRNAQGEFWKQMLVIMIAAGGWIVAAILAVFR